MSSASELLLKALEDIVEADLRKFHFFLNMKVVDGCKPVPRAQLEKLSRDGTVALMVDHYGEDSAVAVTNAILEKMSLNSIRHKLMSAYEEGRSSGPSSNAASSSSSSSTPPPPPAAVTMSAQQGSTIIAPNINGGTIGTLTISIAKP